jgi:hypothetical protein
VLVPLEAGEELDAEGVSTFASSHPHHLFQQPKMLGPTTAAPQLEGETPGTGSLCHRMGGGECRLISCKYLKFLEMTGKTALYTRLLANMPETHGPLQEAIYA